MSEHDKSHSDEVLEIINDMREEVRRLRVETNEVTAELAATFGDLRDLTAQHVAAARTMVDRLVELEQRIAAIEVHLGIGREPEWIQ